jgi:hypothetical protein
MATQTNPVPPKGSTPVAPGAPQGQEPPLLVTPVVLTTAKKKKKKKYSRGTKPFQELAQGLSDSGFRATNSIARSAKTFSKRSKKSSRKKRDGLVRDSVRNLGPSLGDGITELGKAPEALTRRIRTGQIRRAVRLFVR